VATLNEFSKFLEAADQILSKGIETKKYYQELCERLKDLRKKLENKK
jgi:hypothetical protein